MTSENENLIAQARTWTAAECRESPVGASRTIAYLANQLEAAVKAHTPTDDEREAMRRIIAQGSYSLTPESLPYEDVAYRLVEAGFGFRRSEVPEPSAEEWAARINAAREKAIAKGYTPYHDARHGVRHLLRWAIDYSRRGRAEDSSGLVAAAIDLADIAYDELERLRHVADTMSAVSEALRTRYTSDSQAAYFMRQIDAALEAVPEPQGEPSDAQVLAALNRFYVPDGIHAKNLSDWAEGAVRAMRGVLRDAFSVTEQGEVSDAASRVALAEFYSDRPHRTQLDAMRDAVRAAVAVDVEASEK